jgi:outer membrane lipoprotein SlyB
MANPETQAMKSILFGAALTLAGLSLVSTGAEAKGCLKGAAVGGLAGHVAGHGVIGAAAGCAVGRHQANKRDRQQNQAQPAR